MSSRPLTSTEARKPSEAASRVAAARAAANKAASLNELRAASSSGNSDSEEEQSFELFVRRKLIQIALGQFKIEERLGEAIDFNSGKTVVCY